MNFENTSMKGNTDIKVEYESDDEVKSDIDLYADHVIKEEMVIGPVVLQPVVYTAYRPEDVPKKSTDEETDQVKPHKGMKEENTEAIISNVDFKTNITSRNQTNHKYNQTPGLSKTIQYSCPHCNYKSKRKAHLSTHLFIHTGEKPYSCSYCDYKCKQKGSLSVHLRTHTGEKPFSCPYCYYKCNHKGSLTLHLRTHTGEKPFSCSHCDYKSSQKSSLSRHLATIHAGEISK